MKDLLKEEGAFAGKSRSERIKAVDDFVALVAEIQRDERYRVRSCLVSRDEFERVKDGLRVDSPESACVEHCVNPLFERVTITERGIQSPRNIEMYFDWNEPFLNKIDRVWRADSKRRQWWADCVTVIAPVNSQKKVLALQAADVLAWVAHREHTKADFPQWFRTLCGDATEHVFCDGDYLTRNYPLCP